MIHVRAFGELDPLDIYRILHLRSSVFVVEQNCAYLDLDGRDLEADAVHVFATADDRAGSEVVSALRLLTEPDGSRHLGRVVTAPAFRGQGWAARLMDRAMALVPEGAAVHLNAQARLEPWYERWEFRRSGEDILIDDIVHVPMTRRPR